MTIIKYCGILDFDNFLFRNFDFDFSDKYLTYRKIVKKDEFLNRYHLNLFRLNQIILITGRPIKQSNIIYNLLKQSSYKIDRGIFYPLEVEDYNDVKNWIKYWSWKAEHILNIKRLNNNLQNPQNIEFIVFDDDPVIIEICNKFGIRAILLNTIKENDGKKKYCYNCFKLFSFLDGDYCFDCLKERESLIKKMKKQIKSIKNISKISKSELIE